MTKPIAMRDAFLTKILETLDSKRDVYFVTADFGSPVLDKIRANFPKQYINVGIAEQNLINVCAGLGLEGNTVFGYAIAPFLTMRAFEQIRVNLALLSLVRPLNVNLIGVGAGYSYVVSGPTHQCYEDISIMNTLGGVSIYSPSDSLSASKIVPLALENTGIKYIRLDAQILPPLLEQSIKSEVGSPDFRVFGQRKSESVIVATGYMTHTALNALKLSGLKATVIDLIKLTEFDEAALLNELSACEKIITVEEGFLNCGGLDSIVNNFLKNDSRDIPKLNLGLPKAYSFELGSRNELHENAGVGVHGLSKQLLGFFGKLGK